jgi:hypothetical protein
LGVALADFRARNHVAIGIVAIIFARAECGHGVFVKNTACFAKLSGNKQSAIPVSIFLQ